MAAQLNFNQEDVQILLDQINYDNNSLITKDFVTFGTPIANASGAARNTTIPITAVPNSQFTGEVDWQYNRVDISIVPGIRSILIQVPNGAVNISDLIPNINASYGIVLTAADIVDGPLPTFTGLPNEKHPFTLTMAATAKVYYGSVPLMAYNDGTNFALVSTAAGELVQTDSGDQVIARNDDTQST